MKLQFSDWIRRRQKKYEEESNTTALTDVTNKYVSLMEKDKWNQRTKRDKKSIALQATQFEKYDKKRSSNDQNGGKHHKTNGNNKLNKVSFRTSDNHKEPWLFEGPNDGEEETLEKEGKNFYWYKWHGKWSMNSKQTSENCTGKGLHEKKG
jgi:hypothetical protein